MGETHPHDPSPADEQTTLPAGGPPTLGPASVGPYDLLGELGRGGMGVVYRARDRRLGRLVALKMVSAADAASPEQVRRFRAEAEAVAALDHPNIVPVYEAGEHDGRPYLAMRLVEGGRTARDFALPPGAGRAEAREGQRCIARFVADIARAVHFAHQRGIIHRDLKPGNILADAAGTPFVADFGLAKRLEADAATRSGAILGTPAYMPPEQAAGRTVTTLADVYSLGAILYELLTGRPPFKSDSAVETLRRVLDEPPPSPRSLNPVIDRELEAVCLRCLEKEPARRYSSADALADDLARWLDGEPTAARPPGRARQLLRWFQRNLWTAFWVIAVGFAGGVLGLLPLKESYARGLASAREIYSEVPDASSWPSAILSVYAALDAIPPWLAWMSAAVFLPNLGLLAFRLARPWNRREDFYVGVGAGLAAGLTAYSLWVGPIGIFSAAFMWNADDRVDIALAGLSDDDEARRRILARHPELTAEYDPEQRGRAFLRRQAAERNVCVILGVWVGLLLCVLVGPAVGVCGVRVAGMLAEQWGPTGGLLACLEVNYAVALVALTTTGPIIADYTFAEPFHHVGIAFAPAVGLAALVFLAVMGELPWPRRWLAYLLPLVPAALAWPFWPAAVVPVLVTGQLVVLVVVVARSAKHNYVVWHPDRPRDSSGTPRPV